MKNRVVGAVVLSAITLASLGCSAYVNIPAQRGDVAGHNPNNRTVLIVQCEAMRALADHWQINEPFTLRTLPDTEPNKYFALIPEVSEHAMADQVEGQKMMEVRQLHIRPDWTAQVDVVWSTIGPLEGTTPKVEPSPSDVPSVTLPRARGDEALDEDTMATVYLKWAPISGWHAGRIKVWKIPIDNALTATALR